MPDDLSTPGDVIPPLRRTQARLLLAGLFLNVVGGVLAFWSARGGLFVVGWVTIASGIAVALLGGGLRFVPRTPREVFHTARAAGLPALPTTIFLFSLLAVGAVGMVRLVLGQPSA